MPNAVVLPNGRMVDVFCKPVPNESGCAAAGVVVAVFAGDVPNVNVEFNAVGAAVAAGVEPNINPDVAGAAVVVVVVPKASEMNEKKNQNKTR